MSPTIARASENRPPCAEALDARNTLSMGIDVANADIAEPRMKIVIARRKNFFLPYRSLSLP